MSAGYYKNRRKVEDHCREYNAMVRCLQRIKNHGDDLSSEMAKKVLDGIKREEGETLTVRCAY